MSTKKNSNGFSADERAALKQRAEEIREEKSRGKGAAKRVRDREACAEAIAGLEGVDRDVAELLNRVVEEVAPDLDPKTWYGFPSYARDDKVMVFFQPASKFHTRYGTIGFNESAQLDDGPMWATSFAVVEATDAVETHLRALIRRATA